MPKAVHILRREDPIQRRGPVAHAAAPCAAPHRQLPIQRDGSRIALLFLPRRLYFQVMQYERQIFIGMFNSIWSPSCQERSIRRYFPGMTCAVTLLPLMVTEASFVQEGIRR